jgi:hypothetical protein
LIENNVDEAGAIIATDRYSITPDDFTPALRLPIEVKGSGCELRLFTIGLANSGHRSFAPQVIGCLYFIVNGRVFDTHRTYR